MRGEKVGANLPLFWSNDGKDRPKGKICPLAKKEVFYKICHKKNSKFVIQLTPGGVSFPMSSSFFSIYLCLHKKI